MTTTRLDTIGHSNRSLDDLIALLHSAGIRILVDVRAQPQSTRHPQFGQEHLRDALTGAGTDFTIGDSSSTVWVEDGTTLNSSSRIYLEGGVLAVTGPQAVAAGGEADETIERFCQTSIVSEAVNRFPLVVVVDDSDFTARTLNNFLWVVFTRSDPAADVYGVDSFTQQKHWGCRGSLVIDARIKPHHAPPLIEDPEITRRVDALAARGGPLAKYL